jgi:transposase
MLGSCTNPSITTAEGRTTMRGRPLDVEWQESAEELCRMAQQERDPHRRARLRAVAMLRRGKPITEVHRVIGVDYRTVQRWLGWYREGGLAELLRRVPGHQSMGRPPKLSPEQHEALLARDAAGEFATVGEAVAWVREEWGIVFSYPGMHRLLRRHRRSRA